MNNLKRVFSLALTGVMLSGMMVMGASATSFKDDDKIVNQEAVDSCVALSIINGRDDGSFDPNGLVTRAEMAKMIATAVNGGEAPEFGVKVNPTYTDIAGIWAEQYIEYCSDMKYIAGLGDGTFNPYGNVTGVEAAKMILTALGYDATAYQLVGADWAINTTFFATRNCSPSLYEGLNKVNMNAAITRDTAAQMIWNGMQNVYMEYTPTLQVTGGSLSHGYGPNKAGDTLLEQAYDAHITPATFKGDSKMLDGLKDGQIRVSLAVADEAAGSSGNHTITANLDIKHIGEEVKVIWKNEKNTPAGLDAKDTIYGVYPTGKTETVWATLADVSDVASDAKTLKIAGTKYDIATGGINVTTNYVGTGESKTTQAQIEGALKKSNGNAVKFILNDGKVAAAYVVETKLAVVLSKNSSEISLSNNGGTFKIADNEVYEGIAKDDVVVYTRLYDTDSADAYTIVEKAEKVSGEVKGYKDATSGNESVTLDGTTYKIYDKTKMTKSGLGSSAVEEFDGKTGESFDLYLVNGFVAAAVQTSESASNWSVVLDSDGRAGSTFGGLKLQVMGADGTKDIITVSKDTKTTVVPNKGTAALGPEEFPKGSLITYTVNKDGEAVIQDYVPYGGTYTSSWSTPTDTDKYNKDTKTFGGMTTSTDCVLFATNASGDYKAYKIRDLGNVGDGSTNVTIKATKGSKVVAAVMDLQELPSGATSNRVYGIISAENGTYRVDGGEKSWYTASVNGENYELYLSDGSLAKGDIVSFEPSNDNIYADVDDDANTSSGKNKIHKVADQDDSAKTVLGYAKEYNETDGTITIYTGLKGVDKDGKETKVPSEVVSYKGDSAETYVVNDDTTFYWVDKDGKKSVSSGSVVEFDAIKGYNNIIVVHGGGDTKFAKAVIVETSRKADLLPKANATGTPTLSMAKSEGSFTVGATELANLNFDAEHKDEVDVTITEYDAAQTPSSVTFTAAGVTGDNKGITKVTVNGTEIVSGTSKVAVTATTEEFVVKITVSEIGKADVTYTVTIGVTVTPKQS